MKIIDADKLMQHIKHKLCISSFDYLMESEKAIINVIESEPSIEMPTWIPCSERLPESQGYYICTCKDGSKYKRASVVKWSNGWQLTGARTYWVVLAWMPLPEPMKGADDELQEKDG